MRTKRPLLGLLGLLMACAGPEGPPGGPELIERPHSEVRSLALPVSLYAAPEGGLTAVRLVHDTQLGDLLGATEGLFAVAADGLSARDPRPVRGLGVHPQYGVLVGAADHLSIVTATLTASPVFEHLQGELLTALAARQDEVWMGTTGALYRWLDDALLRFSYPQGVLRIATYDGAAGVLLQTATSWVQLEPFEGEWRSGEVEAPWAMDDLYALTDGTLLARSEGALYRRVPQDGGGWTWRPQALDLYAPAETGALALAQDPHLGAVWCLTPAGLYRVHGPQVTLHALPFEPSARTELSVDNLGAVWLAEEPQLVRIGQEAAPITWQGVVADFSKANCERCHAPLSTAHPLDTFELWTAEVDAILSALDAGRMPLDGAPLVGGSADTIRRWRADGLLY